MYLKSISIEVDKVFLFRSMALWNLVKQSLESKPKSFDNLRLCLSYALKLFQQRLYNFHLYGPLCKENFFKLFHSSDAGHWKVIIPSSGLSMQGGREKFHHQMFSLVTDREVLKKFPKSSHVRLGTFVIDASKTREEILITRRHFSWVSWNFAHV